MNTDRVITDWLRSAAPPRAPRTLLDATLERVATLPQDNQWAARVRAVGGRRADPRLLLVAAVLGGTALIGSVLLAGGGPGPHGPSTSPAQSVAKEAPVRLVSWPAREPASGALSPGAYALLKPDGARSDYVAVVLTLPDGWVFSDGLLSKSPEGPDRLAVDAAPVSSVYPDPCRWEQVAASFNPSDAYEPGTLVNSALLAQRDPGVAPIDVLVPGPGGPPGGNPAVVLRMSVPSDLDIGSCDGGEYRRWKTETESGGGQQVPQPRALSGQRDIVYVVDVDREALLVRGSAGPAASAGDLAGLEAILASMVVVR